MSLGQVAPTELDTKRRHFATNRSPLRGWGHRFMGKDKFAERDVLGRRPNLDLLRLGNQSPSSRFLATTNTDVPTGKFMKRSSHFSERKMW